MFFEIFEYSRWYVNEMPLREERGRIKIKEGGGGGRGANGNVRWSQLRFRSVEVHDTGFYRCRASNAEGDAVSAEAFVKVHLKWDDEDDEDDKHLFSDDEDYEDEYGGDYEDGLIPHTFPLDFGADLSGGVDGLPPHLQNVGDNGGRRKQQQQQQQQSRGPSARGRVASPGSYGGGVGNLVHRQQKMSQPHDLPSLKPTEHSGTCQRYTGTICHGYVGADLIFVSDGLTQDYIEQKLQDSLRVISNSPDLSPECAKYAVPAICFSTLPPCDRQTRKPRKVMLNCNYCALIRCENEEIYAKPSPPFLSRVWRKRVRGGALI